MAERAVSAGGRQNQGKSVLSKGKVKSNDRLKSNPIPMKSVFLYIQMEYLIVDSRRAEPKLGHMDGKSRDC